LALLLEVAFDGSVRGGAVLHSIAKGEAWKGLVVACFDCGKPGGWDWVTGRSACVCVDLGTNLFAILGTFEPRCMDPPRLAS
jgi:hypothetical protein